MRAGAVLAAAGGLWLAASPAAAQVLSGEVALVSDYRWRGISLSNGKPAAQASVEVAAAGFYLGGFGSWVPHGGGAEGLELDASAGWRAALGGQWSLDAGVALYHYPRTRDCDYAEATATLGWARGGTEARIGMAYAPRQPNLIDAAGTRGDNFYGFAGVEQAVAGTPLRVALGGGYETGAFDGAARGGKLDWRAGVAAAFGELTISAHAVGALRPRAGAGERDNERGLVLALGRSF